MSTDDEQTAQGDQRSTAEGTTRAAERVLRLVEVIATAPAGMNLSTAAREVDLALSTAGRLMRSLEARGWVWRDAAGNFRAGARLLQVGAVALNHLPIYQMCEPHLVDLAGITGETAYLAVLDGEDHVLYLRQVESPRAIRHALWAGRRIPVAGTAVGSALLGRLDESGFVTSRGTGIEPEAAAAAAPVYDSASRRVAAVSIIGPSFRITEEMLMQYANAVAKHARLMSAELGYAGPLPG